MPFITKQYEFSAAHRYWNEEWSENENLNTFGKDIYVHGHNYLLDITIFGPVNENSGFIIDLEKLDHLVNEHIMEVLDHSHIEKSINWFIDRQPSTENIIIFIWDQIADKILMPVKLHSIKLRETSDIYTEYFGPEGNND